MTGVLLNDFRAQWSYLREEILEAVDDVGQSGWLILGKSVTQFEKKLAHYWGLTHAVGCGNGLDALEIGLRVLGIQAGDKVLTTPLSAFATTLAIIRAGGTPVFVDVDDSGLIDLALCEKILEHDKAIRFFMPVHLYGHALPYEKLLYVKKKFNLKVVEDCAQAIGAKSQGKPVGSAGEIAATSFYPTKNLGCMGDGGALLMSDEVLMRKAKCYRDYGQSEKYIHTELGLNSRLDELHAAVLEKVLLPKLTEFTERRRKIADDYVKAIRHPLITFPAIPEGSQGVWHLFPVLINHTEKVSVFQQHLNDNHIQSGRHYPILISDQEALYNKDQYKNKFKKADYFARHEISLPIHPYMTDENIEHVIHACNTWEG